VARSAPKSHFSRFCRADIFVLVVAQSIQDMSAVSITDKTVGIRLPRLRRGAGLVHRSADRPRGVFFILPFVHDGAGVRLSGVFESARKRSED